ETTTSPVTAATGTAGQGPTQRQMCSGPSDPHIEQAAFLLDRLVIIGGVLNRQYSLCEPHQEHRIPFQPLGGMQRCQRHSLDRGRVLGSSSFVEVTNIIGQRGIRGCRNQFLGKGNQSKQTVPTLLRRTPRGRLFG